MALEDIEQVYIFI